MIVEGPRYILSTLSSVYILLSAAVAVFGLYTLFQVLAAPQEDPITFGVTTLVAPQSEAPETATTKPIAETGWSQLFGQIQPDPAPEPAPVVEQSPPTPVAEPAVEQREAFEPDAFALQGIVADARGYSRALIDVGGVTIMFRVNDMLTAEAEIVEITASGVKIQAHDETYFIEFADDKSE